jgi:ribonuclease Y
LLHDIGKAVDHEVQGHHSVIGADIAKKFGLSKDVAHAISASDENEDPKTIEAMIVNAANKIAVSRPGASKDNLDSFIKRLEEIENIANEFDGVKESFAVHTGSEVRVFVKPDIVDDAAAKKLSYELARKLEKDAQFQGQVKVNVIREMRAENFAK